ncbi:hypothetical protein [Vibrio vulnificus]|uniref:hypothetical protein n=1 Tax=Vibrio vulnificus TaxID=672 RepID=UPI0024E00661|nr:hypothetical protein [Vibrio vulnificus]MDK2640411.1 hypothetical protein [Vibrio vulnificus]
MCIRNSSIHPGKVISLLQNTKQSIDFFNVMAYDAGKTSDMTWQWPTMLST